MIKPTSERLGGAGSDFDPDLLAVTAIVIAALGTLGTWITVLQNSSPDRPQVQPDISNSSLRNIEKAVFTTRSALKNIEELFEVYQNQNLSDEFSRRPRFGAFAPVFGKNEYDEFQHEIQDLEPATNALRQWSRHGIRITANNSYPREDLLVSELTNLTQEMNTALFDTLTFRDQIRQVNGALERVERAVTGARRSGNRKG